MTEAEFRELFAECSKDIGDRFYPVGVHPLRMGFRRDQGVLCDLLVKQLKERGVIKGA